jgi:phage N-6-adenine-methyltransferase
MNMKNTGMFSSNTDLWETPQSFFDDLDREFHFDLDVCAIEENAKCYKFYSPEDDGLKQDWIGTCWMNPPYGRQIGKWVEKAYTEHIKHGSRIVCLLPARTDTKWFHDYILGKAEIRFIKGRLKFGGSKNSAPFPSMVVVYQ